MEIITVSDKKYENFINIKDNSINCIIDYCDIKKLIIKDKNYFLLENIINCFKTKTLETEIEYYKRNISNDYLEQVIKLFDFEPTFLKKDIFTMCSSELRICYIFINLLFNEELIILDDLTRNLDVKNITKLIFILKELKKKNKTILIISKDVEFIHKIADHIIVLKDEIVCSGNKYEVFTNNDLEHIPNVIKFSKKVMDVKKIKIGYRDDIKDLMKDIYRYVS